MAAGRITKRTVDSLAVTRKDNVYWDDELTGFGVRVGRHIKPLLVRCHERTLA